MEKDFGIKDWLEQYKIYKKEFWRIMAAIAIILFAVVLYCNRGKTSESNDDDTTDFFSEAIIEYEDKTGKKIYPTGREFLQRAMERENLTTKEQVLELIKKNERIMWKNP